GSDDLEADAALDLAGELVGLAALLGLEPPLRVVLRAHGLDLGVALARRGLEGGEHLVALRHCHWMALDVAEELADRAVAEDLAPRRNRGRVVGDARGDRRALVVELDVAPVAEVVRTVAEDLPALLEIEGLRAPRPRLRLGEAPVGFSLPLEAGRIEAAI